jgi:hypothetical protein
MRHRLPLRAFLAVLIGFGAPVLLAAPVAAADPVNCCQVGIDSFPGKLQAGAPPQFFTVGFHNGAQQKVTRLSITFTVSAPGVHSGQLHLQRRNGDNWHTVNLSRRGDGLFRGTDSYSISGGIDPGADLQWTYQAWASKDTAAGPIQLVLTASGRVGDGHDGRQGLLGTSGSYQTSIVGAAEVTTPTPTPTPTPSDSPTPTEAAPSDTGAVVTGDPGTAEGSTGSSGRGGGIAWIAYTVGALLLLGGIATIGTILWRRGPQEVETEWAGHEPPPAPDYGPPVPPAVDPYHTNAGMPPVSRPAGATYGAPTTYGTPRTGYDIPRQRD